MFLHDFAIIVDELLKVALVPVNIEREILQVIKFGVLLIQNFLELLIVIFSPSYTLVLSQEIFFNCVYKRMHLKHVPD